MTLTAYDVLATWNKARGPFDDIGKNPEFRQIVAPIEKVAASNAKAIELLQDLHTKTPDFFAQYDYEWALDPAAYQTGGEAALQLRLLRGLTCLYDWRNRAGQSHLIYDGLVARQPLVANYAFWVPRHLPSQDGLHFLLMPLSFYREGHALMRSFTRFCGARDPRDSWRACTTPVDDNEVSDADPDLREAIAQSAPLPFSGHDAYTPGIVRELREASSWFAEAAGDPDGDRAADAFVGDTMNLLSEFILFHEAGHRLHEHVADGRNLASEEQADQRAMELFAASWGWRSRVVTADLLDEPAKIALGPILFTRVIPIYVHLGHKLRARLSVALDDEHLRKTLEETRSTWDELRFRCAAIQGLLGGLLENYAQSGEGISATSRKALKALAGNLDAYVGYLDHALEQMPEEAVTHAARIIDRYQRDHGSGGLT